MTDYSSARLLYRGTRDGFSAAVLRRNGSFPNTITLIKSNKNHVFGGYTSISLNRSNGWYTDPTAFIFSLRRNGTISNVQLRSGGSSDPSAQYALSISSSYLGKFGYNDLEICDQSFSTASSTSNLCYSYDCPVGCSYGTTCSQSFLAGSYNGWFTDEIEVFQLLSPITTTVKPGKWMNFIAI